MTRRDPYKEAAATRENKTERVQLLMSPAELSAIDEWGWSHRIRSRAEVIRRLVDAGMRAEAPK